MLFSADRETKTICALASANGSAALSVVRLSGQDSLKIIRKACPGLIQNLIPRKTYLTNFYGSENVYIDQVVFCFYEKGKSYTGEESVEISCHGSPLIVSKILDALIFFGAFSALNGEFTFRAFMNNKIDLVQAEAVLSVIQSQSDQALKMSLRQLEGSVSTQIKTLIDDLTWVLAHIEASIDFSTEGIEVFDQKIMFEKLEKLISILNNLTRSFSHGRLIKDGVKIVLAGRPNVGKSSLLNNLCEQEKAIVTDVAGTTRDVIESVTLFQGFKFIISDTAGLRETTDVVEKIGVGRSRLEIENADLIFYVYDLNQDLSDEDISIIKSLKGHVILVGNKLDQKNLQIGQLSSSSSVKLLQLKSVSQHIEVSALDLLTRSKLLTCAIELISLDKIENAAVISTVRQFESLKLSEKLLVESLEELKLNVGAEFVAQTLKNALISLQQIVGLSFDDQILDRVFKEFCLGK